MTIAGHMQAEHAGIWPRVRKGIMDRCQAFEAGCRHAPAWFNERLKEIDSNLHVRWDYYERCWAVERFSREHRAWLMVCHWRDGSGPLPLDHTLVQALHDGDMWRYPSIAAYIDAKRARAEAVRAKNERAHTEKILGIVDGMSAKQINEFIDVERAMQTGETIIAHGRAEKTLERMHAGSRKAAAEGRRPPGHSKAVNPGMHPRLYNRITPLEKRIDEGV